MNNITIETTRKRTERYWYEDGIWEIGFGLVNLLLAGYFTLASWAQAQAWFNLPMVVLQLGTLLGIFWLMGRLVRFLKERITYPRTGYVAYRRRPLKARARRILFIGLLSAGIAATLTLVSTSSRISSTTPLITGVIMTGLMVYLGYRYGLLRMYVLAGLALALSVAMALFPTSQAISQFVFFTSYGLIFLASGIVTLAGYLRRTQPQEIAPDYEAPANLEED